MAKLKDPFAPNFPRVRSFKRRAGELWTQYTAGPQSYERQVPAAKVALERGQGALAGHPAVHHVAIAEKLGADSLGSRVEFVAYLKPGSSESERASIPDELPALGPDGLPLGYSIPVRKQELRGKPVVFSLCGGHRVAGSVLKGTCGFAFVQNGKSYFVTNCHVVTAPDANPDSSPVWNEQQQPLGRVLPGSSPLLTTRTNAMDAVLVNCNLPVQSMAISSENMPIVDWQGLKVGDTRTHSYVSGDSVIEVFAPEFVSSGIAEMHGRDLVFANFWKLMPTSGSTSLPQEGHSGSLLFTRGAGGLTATGLVFAGVPGSEVWVFSFSDVWDVLFG